MMFSTYSDVETAIDLTVFAIAISQSLGDLEWVFDGFIAGKREVSKTIGNIKVTGEVLSSSVAITFEPK